MKNPLIKLLATALVAILLIGMVPVYAFASINYDEDADDYYKLISQKNWELAPGITESEIVINNEAGTRRQVMHVVEVDIHNEYTKVIPSSKGMIPTPGRYGTQTMDKQAAYAEANGYGNVVAAMNISLSWYDSEYYNEHPELIGEPLGYLILDGVKYTNSKGQTSGAQTCLVINFDEKDGVARPDSIPKTQIRSTKDAVTGWEEQVIPANFGFLVKDGKVVTTKVDHTSAGAPRSMLGIKADGTIIMVMNDGRQAPFSEGFNSYEMGEAMLKLGCVYAINGDGGGSSQFLSQRPGSELTVNCSPSDGALRATTHGVLVISTAPATGEFVRAHVEVEHDYYTPGSSIQFTAEGSDLVGTPADIPADATWRVTDGMGTIDANGLFTSNGTVGTVTAELVYQGEVVGSASTNIVVPEKIEFPQAVITVPNGESTNLIIKAWYNDVHEVVTKISDFNFALSDNSIGTIDGFKFTATADLNVKTGHINVTLVHDTTKTAGADFRFGKASEVIWDFENGTDDWKTTMWKADSTRPHAYLAKSDVYAVNATNGKVHNGNGAMALVADFSYGNSASWNSFFLNYYGETITIENAQAIGCWLYIPDEIPYIEFSLRFYPDGSSTPKNALVAYGDPDSPLQPGWTYVSFDISRYKSITFKSGYQFVQIYYGGVMGVASLLPYPELNSKVTYYIDNVTIDYSTAVADREAPVFGTPGIADISSESVQEMKGQTVTDRINSFEVSVKDFAKDNSVGIDSTTAKTYVDGAAVDCQYFGGRIVASDIELADGMHTITFEIADMNGNVAYISRQINVQADSDIPTVSVVPHDATLDRILIGSLYYVDIVASNVEKTDKVVVTLDLNNLSSWELDHMTVADGFQATYEIDATNPMDLIATVTITRVGENETVGSGVLASLPIRTWEWKADENPAKGDAYEYTPAERWESAFVFRTIVAVDNIAGVLTLNDATEVSFGAARIQVDTELFANGVAADDPVFAGKDGWHEHTAEAIADKAATCTEAGYTGRTYCAVCDSIVDWGTTVPATGHDITKADGLNECGDCGVAFYYVNGEAQIGWIEVNGSYYFAKLDGTLVDGVVAIDNHTYTFVDYVLTEGSWEHDGVGLSCWWAGEMISGNSYDTHWKTINGKTYYFNNIYVNVGVAKVQTSHTGATWYNLFDENGVFMEDFIGIYEDYYFKNGVMVSSGMFEQNGDYYFVGDYHKLVKNNKQLLSAEIVAGFYLPNGEPFAPGIYYFDDQGRIANLPFVPGTNGQELKNGLMKDYDGNIRFYRNGVAIKAGLVQDAEGNYYYINSTLQAVKNCTYAFSAAAGNGLLPGGAYQFDAEGKLINPPVVEPDEPDTEPEEPGTEPEEPGTEPEEPVVPEVKNGLIKDADGEIRFYKDGVAIKAGLVQDAEGNYYYINSTLKAVKNCKYAFSNAAGNGLLPGGAYQFDAEGKLINPPVVEPDEPDQPDQPDEPDEPDEPVVPEVKNGLIKDADGEIRFYKDGVAIKAGLVQDAEGNYYYINSTLKAVKNCKYAFSAAAGNGLLPGGIYQFDAEGKLIQ